MSNASLWSIQLHHRIEQPTPFELNVEINSDAQNIVLCGASGSGKSLTAQCLLGLVRPQQAHICIAGRTLVDDAHGINLATRKRRIGMVFQDYALFSHLTVAQNIAFGLHQGLLNWSLKTKHKHIEPLLAQFELTQVQQHYPHQLSGGQAQRVAIARAIANQPDVLILDEPFCALDLPLRQRSRQQLSAFCASNDIPTLIITHDLDDTHYFNGELFMLKTEQQASHVVRVSDQPASTNAETANARTANTGAAQD